MDSDNGNKQSLKEGFEDSPNGDVLVDDPDHIARYCALVWQKDYSKERTRMSSGPGNG
jgi:hypothetical protein